MTKKLKKLQLKQKFDIFLMKEAAVEVDHAQVALQLFRVLGGGGSRLLPGRAGGWGWCLRC